MYCQPIHTHTRPILMVLTMAPPGAEMRAPPSPVRAHVPLVLENHSKPTSMPTYCASVTLKGSLSEIALMTLFAMLIFFNPKFDNLDMNSNARVCEYVDRNKTNMGKNRLCGRGAGSGSGTYFETDCLFGLRRCLRPILITLFRLI